MLDADAIADLLSGTLLGGRKIFDVSVFDDPAETALGIAIAPAEVEPAWRVARALVEQTGRWPLAMGDFTVEIEKLLGGDLPPATAIERSGALSIADVVAKDLENYTTARLVDWRNIVEFHLTKTQKLVSSSPTLAEVPAAVARGDEHGLERWLLEYEERHTPLPLPDIGRYMSWWDPRGDCYLVLLPDRRPGAALAYAPWFGFEQTSQELVVCASESWNARFGAELVASWGTLLDFVVTRPPATLDEAFTLAIEHSAIASATMGLPGLTIRDHARRLVGRRTWQLHDRP
jgi:hypothetical protein